MKSVLLFFSLAIGSYANAANEIEVPFKAVGKRVIVKVEKSRCAAEGEKAYQLETLIPDHEYNLVCKLRPPVDQYDSMTPIRRMDQFKYPKTILADIESSAFPELHKQGVKAIKETKHAWGKEYQWATPTMGTTFYSYLCPKKSNTCFRVIHGGIEVLSFDIRNLK